MKWLGHEEEYRGKGFAELVKVAPITVVGIGAIGSNLVFNLVKQGFQDIIIFDKDKVEEKNIGTQIYGIEHVGRYKIEALKDLIYNFTEIDLLGYTDDIVKRVNRLRKMTQNRLLIDCLDNHEARLITSGFELVLHSGIGEGYGEVKWGDKYIVPQDSDDPEDDLCEFPVARNLITIIATLLAESIVRFTVNREKVNFEVSFEDMNIRRF